MRTRKRISSWGNYPKHEARIFAHSTITALEHIIRGIGKVIPRGKGRSYGDSALGNAVISSRYFRKIISFDEEKGVLVCQSGASLDQILKLIVPYGWFLPVVPGTKFISIGGAIAADIHGKNHHVEGSFCDHLDWIELLDGNVNIVTCSATENSELFEATCGGMGLTGMITTAAIRLKKIETAYIKKQHHVCSNLDEIFNAFEQTATSTYSVAWIDCFAKGSALGKGILYTGEHATGDEVKTSNRLRIGNKSRLTVPFYFPPWVLNKMSIRVFNSVYALKQGFKKKPHLTHYEPFFFPLDSILMWNKIYGRMGFLQYQVVIPVDKGKEGVRKLLEMISANNFGSFLSVLKVFGEGKSLLSFPEKGYTLALDFPVRDEVFELLNELDEIVLQYGGKIYLAKDARMSMEVFEKMYPNRDEFQKIRDKYDPQKKFASLQSNRLGLTE